MINESKQAIKQVFDNFDKDHSGFVDQSELKAISKELNQEINDDEVNKLIKVVDVNKDGKISFQEFWDWWQYGKNGKLEGMVFRKLKMMNLIKKAHTEFTRYGGSLLQKYQGDRNYHYMALNYGESIGHLRTKGHGKISGKGVQGEIEKIKKGIDIVESTCPQIIFSIKCLHPEESKKAFEEYYEWFQQQGKEEKIDEEVYEIFAKYAQVAFYAGQNELSMVLTLNHPFFQEMIEGQYLFFLDQLGDEVDIDIDLNFGIKNGFKKLLNKNIKIQKFFFEGFLFEMNLCMNKDLMQQIFGVLQAMLNNSFQKGEEDEKTKKQKRKLKQTLLLPLLLRSSKFHLTFKDMQDVDNLFKGLGLDELLEDQPTGVELLQELIPEDEVKDLKSEEDESFYIYQFFKLLATHLYGSGTVSLVLKKTFATIQFSLEGMKEVFDMVFKENEGKDKKTAGK